MNLMIPVGCRYVPGIQRTEITSSAPEGIGASRRVYTSDTDYLIETVLAWRPEQGFTLALTDADGCAPLPFSAARFAYQIEAAGEGAASTSEVGPP